MNNGTADSNYIFWSTGTGSWQTEIGSKVHIGANAGSTFQSTNAIAIGFQAGQSSQGQNAVAIGYLAGQTNQSTNTIAVSYTHLTLPTIYSV